MRNAILSEVVKIRSIKTYAALGLVSAGLATAMGIAVLNDAVGGRSSVGLDSWNSLRTLTAMGPAYATAVFGLVIGLLSVGLEQRHRTLTWSLLAEPSRARFVAAKVLVHSGAGALVGAFTMLVTAAGVATWVVATDTALPAVEWDGAARLAIGVVGLGALAGGFGAAAGAVVPNLVVSIPVVLFGIIATLMPIVHRIVPDAIEPFSLLGSIVGIPQGEGALAGWAAAAFAAALIVGAAVVATGLMLRRDPAQ